MKFLTFCLLVLMSNIASTAMQPSSMNIFFRSGQTFITWCEDISQNGEKYRIYRSPVPITSGNLSSAELITEVKENSSYFREMHNCDSSITEPSHTEYIDRFILQPVTSGLGVMLSDTTGLFVNTIKDLNHVQRYYAVTTVTSGNVEGTAISSANSAGPVTEYQEYPDAVRYYVDAERDYYIMWLDHRVYNGYEGNVFPFAITRNGYPCSFEQDHNCVPSMHLDGIGTHFPGAVYANYGNMDYGDNGQPTWYFGHHMSKQYDGGCQSQNGSLIQDTVANYTQYKQMQAVLWARRHYNITVPKFHIPGNSMGASGAWGFLIAFPSFVTSIWSNEGLTQYRYPGPSGTDTIWKQSIHQNYGHPSLANPVKFLPFNDPMYPGLDWVTQFNGMNVYDARDVVHFMQMNPGKSFGLFSGGHCFEDGSIPFAQNAAHFEEWIKNSRQCISYAVRHGGHGWGQAVYSYPSMSEYIRWDESRPGFSNVPAIEGCMYNDPSPSYVDTGSRTYMTFAEWGTIEHRILNNRNIIETATSWSIPIVNIGKCAVNSVTYNVDITPRNLQTLKICEGDTFTYTVADTHGTIESHGDLVADNLQLLLIPQVPIRLTGAVASVVLKNRGPNYPCMDNDPPMDVVVSKQPEQAANPEIRTYPNPFNPVVMIAVAVISELPIQIKIYTINGRFVTDLTSHMRNGRVSWDASFQPSGMYIAKMRSGSRILTKRVTLLK